MLKTYLSEAVFQHVIILYLHNHSYASIQSDDLWSSFNEVSVQDALCTSYRTTVGVLFLSHMSPSLQYQDCFCKKGHSAQVVGAVSDHPV